MKKSTLLFILLFVFSLANAQQEISREYARQANAMFAPLNKNLVPHGILLDFGMEFTNLKAYDGRLTDSTIVDAPTLKNIYNTLFSSRIINTTAGFVNPNSYEGNWNRERTAGVITVSGLYFKYASLINDAINLRKIDFANDQFSDKYINNVWQNPYQEFQTFAMTPAIKNYEGLDFQVKIPSAIFYSNFQSSVQSIQIDFGNGAGYITVPFNQNIAVKYSAEGIKVWKYKLNLTNGTSLLSQSRIRLTPRTITTPWDNHNPANPTTGLYTKKITATKAYQGAYGRATLTIDDANNDGIKNPLIVAEGFDPGIIFSPESANGMNTYSSFQTSAFFSGSPELQTLLTGNSLFLNGDQQYDIIYVDWDNGVDYLQKNAFALEEVIKWVNEQKASAGSTEQNVVLGQSMGGVIARYALADMEGSNEVHDTRLFVSHDAPQQGANMPLSAQYMFRHLTSLYNEFSTPYGAEVISVPLLENSLLDQPATQQMVKNWVASNFEIFYPPHTNFYNELRGKGLANSGGYPINCKNVAISNGAECGIFQEFNPGDDLISFNSGTNINMGMSFLFSTAISFVSFAGFFGTGNEGLLGVGFVSLLPGRSKFRLDFNAKSLYYNPGNKIYKGRISYQKKLFSLLGWAPTITVNIANKEVTQPNNVLPFDTYGGGKYETSLFTGDIDMPDGAYIRDNFSFIPTASALDIGKGIVTLNDTDYRKQYVGAAPPIAPKNSPFENFITDYNSANPNASNSAHISFNSRNGLWLARELTEDSITSNCSFMCGTTEILGSEVICTNGTFTVPAGAVSYTWSIIGSSASKSSSGNTATLTRVGQLSGSVTLRVVIDGGNCGTLTLEKNVWIGVPIFNNLSPVGNQSSYNPNEPSISYEEGSDACNQIRLKANFDSPDILEYQWEKITTDVTWSVISGSGDINLFPQCNKNFSFRVRARNICGWSDWKQLEFYMNRCTIDCSTTPPNNGVVGNNFILSPNPVTNNSMLDIAIKNTSPWFYPPATIDPNTGLPIPPPLTIKKVNISIYGSSMNLLQSYTNKTVPTQLDISNFPQGSYLVIFEYQGAFENYTIIKG